MKKRGIITHNTIYDDDGNLIFDFGFNLTDFMNFMFKDFNLNKKQKK